mgnify:CR=1 FL=1
MSAFPEIFSFASCPVSGELGDDAVVEYRNECSQCRRNDRIVTTFDYRLDAWSGEEMLTYDNLYALTRRLARQIEASGCTGVKFQPMVVSTGKMFADMSARTAKEIPPFQQMVIETSLDPKAMSPSGWWIRKAPCPSCGRAIWDHSPAVDAAIMAPLQGVVGPPREVARAGWPGTDIYYHEDPGPPLVTARFKNALESERVKGVAFHPARWV